jgi:multicomponent Na+:H+ antiporter subunit G
VDAVIAGVLGLVGAALTLLAGVGALRFPDALARMHAATKASTLGLLLIVIGAEFEVTGGSTKLAMAVGLVFLTGPVAAHLVGRSAYRAAGIALRVDTTDELAEAENDTANGDTAGA